MPLEFTFTCSLIAGLHARPAAQLANRANAFVSASLLTNLRNGRQANLKSPLAIIAANVTTEDICSVLVSGSDEKLALAALRQLLQENLSQFDGPLISPPADDKRRMVPRQLAQIGTQCYFGRPVHRGVGQGKVVFVNRVAFAADLESESVGDPRRELQRIRDALANVQSHIRAMQALPGSVAQKAILNAQLSIAADISLAEKLEERVAQGRSAGQAVADAGDYFLSFFRQSESTYIRERAFDFQDVLQQLLQGLYGSEFQEISVNLKEPSVAVAEALSPQQLLSLDRKWLTALVLESSSTTSHAVILARSLGIPTLVGVKDALNQLSPGQETAVDSVRGIVVPCSHPAVREFYAREANMLQRRRDMLLRVISEPVQTTDGRKIEVAANVSGAEELETAFTQGADGIGLFRTETLFMARKSTPDEKEQFALYAQAVQQADKRRVIIRTLDTGADKPIPQLYSFREDNPFLGYRGVRIYPDFRNVIHTQVRAILRASASGRVQIMAPMISSLDEGVWMKALIVQAQNELASENVSFDPSMPVGAMIETPSAAFMLKELCAELDFFSIGTNDLCQYFFAADRGNNRVAALAQSRQPAFLRFLHRIVKQVHEAGKWIGMCGDMAADPANLPLLIGLELDEVSVPASQIAELKRKARRLSATSCRELLAKAMACKQLREVDDLLGESASGEAEPLLIPELVVLDDEIQSKEAAISAIVEALYLTGRTEDPQLVEEAIWNRETISSTGFGYGFAIPHCKTDAMLADSVSILKFQQPINWGSLDDQPVQMVIVLALRESQSSNRHLQILSQLARKLMTEDFRARLLSFQDANATVEYLSQEFGGSGG